MIGLISRWLPVMLWAGLIYLSSEIDDPKTFLPDAIIQWMQIIIWHKTRLRTVIGAITHFTEFCVFFLLLARALNYKGELGFWSLLAALDISLVYAVSDEVHQMFVPGRLFEVKDLVVDSAGVVFGLIMYLWFRVTATD